MKKNPKLHPRKKSRSLNRRAILGQSEVEMLYFLWRHRVATFKALRHKFYADRATETCYNRLRKLKMAEFILSEYIEGQEARVWSLGPRGMRYLESMRLPELKSSGYKSKTKYHDLLAMAALLGDWLDSPPESITTVTEQELLSTEVEEIPSKLRERWTHRPDGLWIFKEGQESKAIALEVEINGKSLSRYEEICSFYGSLHFIENVIWIVSSKSLAKKIHKAAADSALPRSGQHIFVELEEFEAKLWETRLLNASLRNSTLSQYLKSRLRESFLNGGERGIKSPIERGASKGHLSIESPLLDSSISLPRFSTYKRNQPTKNC